MRFVPLLFCLFVAGCAVTTGPLTQSQPRPQSAPQPVPQAGPAVSSSAAVRNFNRVVAVVEPVAERTCRAQTRGMNCDFRIVVDSRPELGANAYQTLDSSGRPIIGFTPALIRQMRNADELAFVMAHEAAHHIEGHIAQTRRNATAGALIVGLAGAALGADQQSIQSAQRIGATVGARRYAKEFELEADALGTVIAARAGFDPVRGAAFFTRIPDPGDRFLGTHPPNADRIRTVQRVAAGL